MTGKAGNQFVPFLIKSELGNETSNYYAVDYNEDAEEILDASMLFRCQARFASQENRLEDFFTVKAVFNTKMRCGNLVNGYNMIRTRTCTFIQCNDVE